MKPATIGLHLGFYFCCKVEEEIIHEKSIIKIEFGSFSGDVENTLTVDRKNRLNVKNIPCGLCWTLLERRIIFGLTKGFVH